MVWALLIFITAVVVVHWWIYRRSVQEYTFAAPATLRRKDELAAVLAERTPVAVEIGVLPWRPTVAEKAGWMAAVAAQDGAVVDMPVATWLKEPAGLVNGHDLAIQMDLGTGLGDIAAARSWWWLPGVWDSNVGIARAGEVVGFEWVGAERRWIGCSHGEPLTVWLVHSRYRPYLPTGGGYDPWALTVAEAPWIGRVQYIEVIVKPGWALGLPAHWGYAMRPAGTGAESSWWWTADQHSAMSWALAGRWSLRDLHDQQQEELVQHPGEEEETTTVAE
jgi:hypothetical protein